MQRMMRPTGGSCFVHESRIEEYLAAGYKLAAVPPVKAEPEAVKEQKPKKAAAKKPAAKKTNAK